MAYEIRILNRAERELAAIPAKDRTRIGKRIDALADNPRPAGARPLKGEFVGHFRLRVGDYRVIYQIRDEVLIVVVVRIGHRKEVYRS
jgi:mRNA interferase RelE/StbE